MKNILFLLALVALPLGAAQLYKWTDEKGNVEWRDTPPPPNAKKVEQRNMGGNTIETSTLPYSVQQAVKNNPVTLWAFDCGPPCSDARSHLARRGIPYTEKNGQKDQESLKKITGSGDVPVLIVGSKPPLKGYLATSWDATLDEAGYPSTAPPGMKTMVKTDAAKDPKPSAKAADTKAPAPLFPR
jgi:glutaredoxin